MSWVGLLVVAIVAFAIWRAFRKRRRARLQPQLDEQLPAPAPPDLETVPRRTIGTIDAGPWEFKVEAIGAHEIQAPAPVPMPSAESVPRRAYLIDYANAEGELSTRVVAIRDVARRRGELYFVGYCYLARDKRTFRADRILSIRDYHTGAKIDARQVETDLAAPPATGQLRRKASNDDQPAPTFTLSELRKNPATTVLLLGNESVELNAERLSGEAVALTCSCDRFRTHGLCVHCVAVLGGEVADLDYDFSDVIQGTMLARKAIDACTTHGDYEQVLAQLEDIKPSTVVDTDYLRAISDAADEISRTALGAAIEFEELRAMLAEQSARKRRGS